MRRLVCLLPLLALSAVALASPDETVTFNEPQPGGTITAASQSINSSKKVIVGVKGDLEKTTVVVEGGTRGKAVGDAVAACWLAGPGAIPVKNARIKNLLETDDEIQETYQSLGPEEAVSFCMAIVSKLAENLGPPPTRAVASASRCQASPIVLRFGADGPSVAKRKAGPRTRYRCRMVPGGIDLTATDARGRPLRKALGAKLDVGLYKSTDGPPSNGKMSLRYRLR
jgi:hypothetical protein